MVENEREARRLANERGITGQEFLAVQMIGGAWRFRENGSNQAACTGFRGDHGQLLLLKLLHHLGCASDEGFVDGFERFEFAAEDGADRMLVVLVAIGALLLAVRAADTDRGPNAAISAPPPRSAICPAACTGGPSASPVSPSRPTSPR